MNKAFLPAAISAALLLTACGGESNNSSNTNPNNQSPGTEQVQGKSLVMNIDLAQLQSSGLTADKVVVTISKGEFTETLEVSHENYAATAEFSNLVVGDYQIEVDVFDGETLVAEGTASATVSANQVATTDLRLELKAGGLVVEVCVPGQAPDTLWSESFQYTDKNGLRVPAFAYKDMFIGELGYHNSLPYIDIAEGSAVSVDLTIDQTFEKVSDTQYKATSDHHALLIKNNGNEILELSSCNAEVSLSIINNDNHNGMLDTDYQGMENSKYAGDVLELRVTVPVDGIDYATAGDVVLAKDAIAGGEPQYRAITSLSYVVFFQHFQSQLTLSELLATADVASLFAMSYDHEAYIQTSGVTEKLANVAPELAGGAMLKEYDFTPMPFILTPVVDEVVE